MNTEETKELTAKDWLLKSSPNEEFGLRAELQKHRLRVAVEKEMEAFAQAKLQEKPELTDEILKAKAESYFDERAERSYLTHKIDESEAVVLMKWVRDHQPPQRVECDVCNDTKRLKTMLGHVVCQKCKPKQTKLSKTDLELLKDFAVKTQNYDLADLLRPMQASQRVEPLIHREGDSVLGIDISDSGDVHITSNNPLNFPDTCPDTHEVQKRIMKAYKEHELSVDEMWKLVHKEHLYFVNQYKAMREAAEEQ